MAARIDLRASYTGPVLLGFMGVVFACLAATPVNIVGKLIFLAIGVPIVVLAVKLGKRRLVVDENGVTAKGTFGTQTILWNELDHYTFWSMDQQMGYAYGGYQAGLAGVIIVAIVALVVSSARNRGQANRRFGTGRLTIVGNGRKIAIDARFKGVVDALDTAFEVLHARLRASGRRDYAPFGLGNGELHDAVKGTLALPDIEKISVVGGRMIIKKRGKRLAWSKVHMKNIRNGMLFIEELGEHGLIVDAKAGMFVPPTVLEKLHASSARQAALPAARVVSRD